jgi:hypothetical protein
MLFASLKLLFSYEAILGNTKCHTNSESEKSNNDEYVEVSGVISHTIQKENVFCSEATEV